MLERVKSALVGLGAGWILVLMFILSIVSVAVMLERAWLFISLRDDLPTLMKDLAKLLRAGDLAGARKRLERSPSAEAAVVVAGMVEADQGPDAAEEAMSGASALQRSRLEKRLAILGTIGNNAPFIGLLGTVIGIVAAFDELARESAASGAAAASGGGGSSVSAALQAHISEALVATAVGLFVAIPAVAAYNFFQRLVKSTLANTDALGHMLLSHLKATDGSVAIGTSASRSTDEPAADNEPARASKDKKKTADLEDAES
ncbi:MotA/TolQ/ExbB proton channel family protein [soil metagenome]